MKQGERKARYLIALTCVIIFGLGVCCLAQSCFGADKTTGLCGAVLCLAGVGLTVVWGSSYQKMMKEEREAHETEVAALKKTQQEELNRARKAAVQEIERFQSSLSHSLRMPVAIIQGYAELLAGDMISNEDTRREYLEKIVQRSRDMSDVMSRHFSAEGIIDANKLSCEKLDLPELIRKAAADMQKAAAEKNIVVQVISAEDTIEVEADGYLINRVMFNLLENALKYMGRPGTVNIRVLRQEGMVSVVVQDDGLGLAPEEASRVFEARFQGSNRMNGSGYGLYFVKQAVEAHGGIVTAQSAPGRGMGIALTIPLKRETMVV